MSKRELLFSLTAKDFKWEYYRASGPGGQHRNKRDTACRCTHEPSGGVGISADERHQRRNRETAFRRCVSSEKFKLWHRIECAKILKGFKTKEEIEAMVDKELNNLENLKVELKDAKGKWYQVNFNDIEDMIDEELDILTDVKEDLKHERII